MKARMWNSGGYVYATMVEVSPDDSILAFIESAAVEAFSREPGCTVAGTVLSPDLYTRMLTELESRKRAGGEEGAFSQRFKAFSVTDLPEESCITMMFKMAS